MRVATSILGRGIRSRLAASLLSVAAAVLAFSAAVVAPLYLRAAEDSVVRSTITGATVASRGATLSGGVAGAGLPQIQASEALVVAAGGRHRFYGDPITSVVVGVATEGYLTELYNRTAICAHLTVLSGTCGLEAGTVMVSQRSAALLDTSTSPPLAVGATIEVGTTPLMVAGIYAVADVQAPYWWGDGPGIFDFGTVQNHMTTLDPLIASLATERTVPSKAPPSIVGQVPLSPGSVNLSTVGGFGRDLAAVTARVADMQGVVLTSAAPALLAGAAHQRHVMSTIVVTVAVQLLVLALWVLASVVVRSSEARQSEIRLARVRGFPWPSVVGVIAAEPAVLCLAALPLGALLAWATVRLSSSRLFVAHTSIATDGWLWVSAASAVAGIAVALAIGAVRVYRATSLAPPALGSARKGGAWRTRAGAIGDVVILVLTVATLVELIASGAFAGGGTDPLAAMGPGLVALGVAVIGVQVVLLAARIGASRTVGSSRVAVFLAVRQVARRPVLLRQARVLVVALCLACFASAAWSVARSNRVTVARFQVGAATVATVTPRAGVDLEAVVDRLDPAGRDAMAAALIATPSSTLLAVDPSRLEPVASWPPGITATSERRVVQILAPPTAPEVRLTGSALQVDATVNGGAVDPGAGPVDLDAFVYNLAVSSTFVANLGPVAPGSGAYRASLQPDCDTPCRLSGLSLVPTAATSPGVFSSEDTKITVTGVQVVAGGGRWVPVAADLRGPGWSSSTPGVAVAASTQGPILDVSGSAMTGLVDGVNPTIQPMAGPADRPAELPAVVTTEEASVNDVGAPGATVATQGLDGDALDVAPSVQVSSLPQVGADAAMTNLRLLQRAETSVTLPAVTFQVWLAAGAPRDFLDRLAAAGVDVTAVQRAATTERQLDTAGPALADDFLLLATVAALLVAGLSTVAALSATSGQRATELAHLEIAGVARRSLVWSLLGESVALAVTALFGVAAGLISVAIAVPSLPELAAPPLVAAPLRYPLPLTLLAVVSGAVILVVLLAGGATNVAVTRRSARETSGGRR